MTKYCAHLHHTLVALKRYFLASLIAPLLSSEQNNDPSSNYTYTKSTPHHIHHHYAPFVTLTYTTRIISSTAPTYAPQDLWIDSTGVTALLVRWTDNQSGGPQAGRSDSPKYQGSCEWGDNNN